jgi:hypothetical protein
MNLNNIQTNGKTLERNLEILKEFMGKNKIKTIYDREDFPFDVLIALIGEYEYPNIDYFKFPEIKKRAISRNTAFHCVNGKEGKCFHTGPLPCYCGGKCSFFKENTNCSHNFVNGLCEFCNCPKNSQETDKAIEAVTMGDNPDEFEHWSPANDGETACNADAGELDNFSEMLCNVTCKKCKENAPKFAPCSACDSCSNPTNSARFPKMR